MKQISTPYSFHKSVLKTVFLSSVFFACASHANLFGAAPPPQPTDAAHPASATYKFEVSKSSFQSNGRTVDVFLPVNKNNPAEKFPVIVYGHGQAIDLAGYELSFLHLAKKGIAVVFPQYDTGFWDQSWRRMADDFNQLTQSALTKYPALDSTRLIYSGHSKGGYIGLMAAGAPSKLSGLRGVLVFSPAGFDQAYLKAMDPQLPLTLVWGDQDTIITQSSVQDIYEQSPSLKKQFIETISYEGLPADHFFVMSDSSFFGGRKGTSAHHYFGSWKWMWGAIFEDAYLYGNEAPSTGTPDLLHKVIRNF